MGNCGPGVGGHAARRCVINCAALQSLALCGQNGSLNLFNGPIIQRPDRLNFLHSRIFMRALQHLTAEFPSRPKPGGKRDPQRLIEIPDLAFSPKRLVISPWLISKPRMMMSQGHPDATARCLQKVHVAAIHQPPFPLFTEK